MYRAQEDHWGAKALGFVLVPALSTVAGSIVASMVVGADDDDRSAARKAMLALSAASAAGAFVAYRYSEKEEADASAQAFARGGMWGQAINAGLYGAGALAVEKVPARVIQGVRGRDLAPRLTEAGQQGNGNAPANIQGVRWWNR